MLISTLEQANSASNRTRVRNGLKPITSYNQLARELDKKGLHISKPVLERLWFDAPYQQKKRAEYIEQMNQIKAYSKAHKIDYHKNTTYKKIQHAKNQIVGSISFETLNKLCKFYNNSRVQDFIRYIGSWTDIQFQDLHDFNATHNMNDYELNVDKIAKGSTVVLVTDSHKHDITSSEMYADSIKHTKDGFTHFNNPRERLHHKVFISGKQKYILVFVPKFIQTGIHKSHNNYTIQCAYFSCLTSKPHLINVQEALMDIFSNLSNHERKLLDAVFIHNFSKSKNTKGEPLDKSPLWHNMQNVPVLDGFGSTTINSDTIEAPKLTYSLSKKSNDSSYNFRFFDKIE